MKQSATHVSKTAPAAAHLYDSLLRHLIANPHVRIDSVLLDMQPFRSNMNLSEKLAQIDQLKTWLDSFRPLQQAVLAELKQRYDVRLTYTSNAIEGNTLTQSETELVLSKGITVGGKTLVEHLEVIGHKEAIDYIELLSKADTPIGEWEIRQIHNLIVRKISPSEAGRYRQLDVKAAGTDHVYPPHYLLPELMTEFVDWLAIAPSRQQPKYHPIEYASEAHYRFVSIHPFADGNGRTGRLLMNLLLLRASFPIAIISNEKRQAYLEALMQAQAPEGGLTPLLSLICDAIYESFIETLSVVANAASSQGKGLVFYQDVVDFLSSERH